MRILYRIRKLKILIRQMIYRLSVYDHTGIYLKIMCKNWKEVNSKLEEKDTMLYEKLREITAN